MKNQLNEIPNQQEYLKWRKQVISILHSQKIITNPFKITHDIYFDFFKDGYTPVEAVKADLGCNSIKYFNPQCPCFPNCSD